MIIGSFIVSLRQKIKCAKRCASNSNDMKTTTATIRFVLITSRTNKKGECPIVLRVQWNGRKEKYTGFSVPKLKWYSKNECVKPCKSLPYALINETLIKTKSKLLKKKALYESKVLAQKESDPPVVISTAGGSVVTSLSRSVQSGQLRC